MRLSSKILIAFFLIMLVAMTGRSQSDPPLRIEIDAKSDEAMYRVIACGDLGFIMFYQTTLTQDDYKFWTFVSYNIFMQETWKKEIPVYKNVDLRKKLFKDGNLYLIFHDVEKKKKELSNFQVLKIDIANTRYELYSGELPENSKIVDFDVFHHHIIAGIDIGEEQTAIIVLDEITKETRTIFEMNENSSRFESLYFDTLKNSFTGVINVFTTKSEYHLILEEFDTAGNNLQSTIIRPGENKKLNSGNVITINENERLVLGTYDFVKGGTIDKKSYFHNESSGFYSIKINGNQQGESRYFNFLEMENMTGYLKSKEYVQALKKAERKDDNPDKYSLDFDLLLHDIVKKDSLYYFVSEAYYEEYHTVTSTYYDYYGRPVPVSYSVFDGYKYFNAFISCFTKDGIKLWDNGLEIFNILTFDLENRVNIYFAGDEIILSYNREGKIGAKIIKGAQIVEGLEYYPLESTYINDKIIGDSKSSMEFWYDNYFIAYGFQNIRNNTLVGNDKRIVFYLNKVSFK